MYSPTFVNVVLKVLVPDRSVEGDGMVGPLWKVTLCSVRPEFHVHVTVPPACTTTLSGVNAKSVTATAPAVGGAWPNSLKLATIARPGNVALKLGVVSEPRESRRT